MIYLNSVTTISLFLSSVSFAAPNPSHPVASQQHTRRGEIGSGGLAALGEWIFGAFIQPQKPLPICLNEEYWDQQSTTTIQWDVNGQSESMEPWEMCYG
jgi:hypothetical protein